MDQNQKMLQLLIDATNELLYILRNNEQLKHTGEIPRIINESRDLIEQVKKQ